MPDAFEVKDCSLMSIATGQRAQNLRELHDRLETVDPGCIYYHFWGGLLRPHFDNPEYPNDFAAWAKAGLNDPTLAERLGVLDPSDFDGMELLRRELIETIEERLDETDSVSWAGRDSQFHFIHSQIVIVPTNQVAKTPEDLKALLPSFSMGSVFYHFIDARRRVANGTDDFRAWLDNFGNEYKGIIDALAGIDPYFSSLLELKSSLLTDFDQYL